jgi:hypothetical protein
VIVQRAVGQSIRRPVDQRFVDLPLIRHITLRLS